MKRRPGGLRILFVPEEGGESRSIRLSRSGVRWAVLGGISSAVVIALMAMTWWFLALEASKGWRQEALLDSLQAERGQILSLVAELDRLETEYTHLRSLFGPSADPVAPDLWLPPAGLPGTRPSQEGDLGDVNVPSGWPLAEAGYVTQPLIQGDAGDHPGLDIAVATDSYIRASGAGRILRTGEDAIYGRFVVVDHGQGYQSVYAHASMILVDRGENVRRGEVIGLTGSSGRSTAPHLHFEILLDGLPVDPFTLVEQPG
jgi:murein DD-endopeptidase MepM/ murein hydrolase activator NlpD